MKRQILSGAGIVLFAIGLITAGAEARPVTIYIEAEVDYVDDIGNYLEGKINPGDTITGYYTYESTTADTNPSAQVGDYWQYSALTFATNSSNVNFLVEVVNDYPTGDDYGYISYNNEPLSNGHLVDHISWQLDDYTGLVFSSDALPLTAPVLSDWQFNRLNIEGDKSNLFRISADVTTAVPEPSSILLIALGTFFLRKLE